MTRRQAFYFGTNLKMYKNIAATTAFLRELVDLTADLDFERLRLFVIPSYTALPAAEHCLKGTPILLGAQNMAWAEEGQFTGEISPLMLQEVGVRIAELGHSERRHVLGETDEQLNLKVRCALRNDLVPLLCVGETGRQKDAGISAEVISIQLKTDLSGVTPAEAEALLIAYEPVWAIGTAGVPASKTYADAMHRVIRGVLVELFGESVGGDIPILYGGSVNNENAPELAAMPHVDGLFIGRSAWDAANFRRIIGSIDRA